MMLKDSGCRREFASGAVRDIAEGKGRCDLMPLDVLWHMYSEAFWPFKSIDAYIRKGDIEDLESMLRRFLEKQYGDPITGFLEVSKHYEDGALKYAERNFEKGIPLHCFIDSAVRHYLKMQRGDDDEPHDRAFVWNILGAIWMHVHHPELIDLPFRERPADGSHNTKT